MKTHLTLDQLTAFVTAAEQPSFSAAARTLGRAQSAVSVAIANLEDDLGVALFDRSGHKPVLTPQGTALLEEARTILRGCTRLERKAHQLMEGVENRVTLATDELIPEATTLAVLTRFAEAWPEVELELLMGALGDIGHMVATGRADVGYLVPLLAPEPHAPARLVGQVRFVPVAAPAHPLAGRKGLELEEVEQHRQIIVASRGGERVLDERRCLRPWWCDGNAAIQGLVRRGAGWAFLPEHAVRKDVESGLLTVLHFAFHPVPHAAPAYVTWTQAHHAGPAARWLRDVLTEELRQVARNTADWWRAS